MKENNKKYYGPVIITKIEWISILFITVSYNSVKVQYSHRFGKQDWWYSYVLEKLGIQYIILDNVYQAMMVYT